MSDSLNEALGELNGNTNENENQDVLVIDPITREIHLPQGFIFGVYNDKDVLTVPFLIPRYYGDIDFSDYRITINYMNASGNPNFYDVVDLNVGTDTITFNWILGRAVFVSAGTVRFIVCIRNIGSNGKILNEFNTRIYSASVLSGLEVDSAADDPEAYSILAHMKVLESTTEGYKDFVTDKAAEVANVGGTATRVLEEANTKLSQANTKFDQATAAVNKAEEEFGAPLMALTAADMTNTKRVYVYAGSETGYTYGDWYYYDGSAWVSGGAYNAASINTDTTLAISGRPADSKATGDALAEKVDKVTGKGLSTNDYTTEEKNKLAGIAAGATNVTVDSAMSQVSTNPVQNKVIYGELDDIKSDVTELEESKANKDGNHESLTAGNADQLLTDIGVTDKVPYLFRTSGGSIDIGNREEDKIVGGTVAWNQLYDITQTASETVNSVIFTNSGTKISISGSATSNAYKKLQQNVTNVAGHKYLIVCSWSGTEGVGVYDDSNTRQFDSVRIATIINASGVNIQFKVRAASGYPTSNCIITPLIFDLTQMFGSSIADRAYAMEQLAAGSGIAWLKGMGFFQKDYYAYDAGTLKSVEGLTAHSMVGFNQWDEEWEVGGLDPTTGQNLDNVINQDRIRSKNYIPVVVGQTYYFGYFGSVASPQLYLCTYDANKTFIERTSESWNQTKTFDDNVRYIRFFIYKSGTPITVYNYDICINLSDPVKNGTYEPYVKHSYPLDSTLTLRGIPKLDANNQLYYDGDEYASDGTVNRRYGIITFDGSEAWIRDNGADNPNGTCFSFDNQSVPFVGWGNGGYINTISNKLTKAIYGAQGTEANNTYWWNTVRTGYRIIYGSPHNGTTVEQFKAYLQNNPITILGELATPTTETADPFQTPQIVNDFGTEEYVTTSIVPAGHETFYPENLKAKILGLPWNFSTLIAPTEVTYKAARAYTSGNLFIVNNILYKATTSIANGGTITPGTNCTATTLAEIIAAL